MHADQLINSKRLFKAKFIYMNYKGSKRIEEKYITKATMRNPNTVLKTRFVVNTVTLKHPTDTLLMSNNTYLM